MVATIISSYSFRNPSRTPAPRQETCSYSATSDLLHEVCQVTTSQSQSIMNSHSMLAKCGICGCFSRNMTSSRQKQYMGSGLIAYRWSLAKQDLSGHGFMGFGRLTPERDGGVAVSAVEPVARDQRTRPVALAAQFRQRFPVVTSDCTVRPGTTVLCLRDGTGLPPSRTRPRPQGARPAQMV